MQIETLVDGLVFPEGPRWRDGTLWFSDIWDDRVARVSPEGECITVAQLEQPSGLGWLPDGRLLIVAMAARKLMRLEPSGDLAVHADLSPFADWPCNDMVVADDGTAYVGYGDRFWAIDPGGHIRWTLTSTVPNAFTGTVPLLREDGIMLINEQSRRIIGVRTNGGQMSDAGWASFRHDGERTNFTP